MISMHMTHVPRFHLITKTSLFRYIKNYTTKTDFFSAKNLFVCFLFYFIFYFFIFFHISALYIDCWFVGTHYNRLAEAILMSANNLCF